MEKTFDLSACLSQTGLATLIVVSCHVPLVYVQIMVSVQFPEFTVDDIEMLIGKVLSQLVNILLLF